MITSEIIQSSANLLLVEDEAILAVSQTQFLESYGYSVSHVANADDALYYVSSHSNIDLVLMDIQISGGMDGISLAEKILSIRELPIIFVSSYSENELLQRIGNIKHYGFVPKLSNPQILECVIKSALKLFEARKELALRENELRTTFDSIGDAIIVTDAEGIITEVNLVAADMVGYSKAEMLTKSMESVVFLIHSHTRGRFEHNFPPDLEEKKNKNIRSENLIVVSRNGKETPVSQTVSPLFDENKKFKGMVFVFRESDVSEKPISPTRHESIYAKVFQLSPIAMALTRVKDGTYFDINPAMEEMFGLVKTEVIGQPSNKFNKWNVDGENERIQKLFREKGKIIGEKMQIRNGDGEISDLLLFAQGFEISGEHYVLGMNLDISKSLQIEKRLAKSLEEKEILLKELQHRVKNSLAIVSGLLSMEAFKVEDPKAKQSFLNAQSRITSMSKVYESLYQSQDLESVNLKVYIEDLVHSLHDIFVLNPTKIRFVMKLADIHLDLKRALPLGLVLNELLTNALKYAYPGDSGGEVRIHLTEHQNNVNLTVSDDGCGLPEEVNINKGNHFGYELIRSLTSQIKGIFSSVSKAGEGLTVIIAFPLQQLNPKL
ncbi:PAS domain S-box protein [Leptospira sp. 96542]|nr:PAS domain S-box protein [Leptospira sp. 96542]